MMMDEAGGLKLHFRVCASEDQTHPHNHSTPETLLASRLALSMLLAEKILKTGRL